MISHSLQLGKRIFRSAGLSLWRNKITVFFSAVVLSFLFVLVHLSVFFGIFIDASLYNTREKMDIVVFMDPEATSLSIDMFRNELQHKKDQGDVRDFWEMTRQERYELFRKKYPDQSHFVERYKIDNPLQTAFGILPYSDQKELSELETWLRSEQFRGVIDQKELENVSNMRKMMERFVHLSEFLQLGISLVRIFLLLLSFLIIFHMISLLVHARKKEVSIMKLVGARLSYIRMPFLLEGIFLGILGFLFSIILLMGLVSLFQIAIEYLLHNLYIDQSYASQLFSNDFFFFFTLGKNGIYMMIFSLLASFFAVERALKSKDVAEF